MKGRILVVDDEANIRSALAKLLSKFGHSVESAGTAQEALQLLQPGRYRVVLTDLRMPGADGLSLLRQIKAADRSIEVIVMTAYGTVDTAVEAMREGAYDYIEKPVNQERLPILIDRVLEKQALADDNSRLRETVKIQDEFGGLIGKTEKMAHLVREYRAGGRLVQEDNVRKSLLRKPDVSKPVRRNNSDDELYVLTCDDSVIIFKS